MIESALWIGSSAVALAGPRAGAQDAAAAPEMTGARVGYFERLRPSNPVEWTGLGGMLLALVLIASARYLARSRRGFVILAGCILFFALGGYALYDCKYVYVHLSMRNAAKVREDCELLLRNRRTMTLKLGHTEQRLAGDELPESFLRAGFTVAFISPESVLMLYGPNANFGVLYDPQRTYRGVPWMLDETRHMWHSGFYRWRGFNE